MIFSDFHFTALLQEGLDSMGFEKPTPIQEQAIPIILSGKDIIACAQTGTGKTAAFLLPLIHKITEKKSQSLEVLVVVPTRELAMQIDEALQGFSYFTRVSSLPIYGGTNGMSFEQEKKALKQGANIIIATPGRLLSHLNLGYVQISGLKHLVLDEADRMLDMGFSDDIHRIISFLPAERQTLLFSATMPTKIRELSKRILKSPEEINISISKPAERVNQGAYIVFETQKKNLLLKILNEKNYGSALIFSSTKEKVKEIERELQKQKGIRSGAIHSDLEQEKRNEVLRNFKNKNLTVLVATDILSRGIDIDSIGLVLNYDVPGDAEDYIHRVGRTARAENSGNAITFVNIDDQRKFKRIEDFIGAEIPKLKGEPTQGPYPDYEPEKIIKKKPGTFGTRRRR